MRIILVALNAKYIHSSLGLRCIRAYLDNSPVKAKIQVQLNEYSINNNLLDILADIYPYKPDLVGLACYIWNIEEMLKLAALLKKALPEVKIVLGGPEMAGDFCEISGGEISEILPFSSYNYVDYIILGEGEKTFASLVNFLLNGGDSFENHENIPGLLKCQGGSISGIGDCFRPQIVECLDSIPFPYTAGDISFLKDKIIYYETSRGCPFSCQYCLSGATSGVRFLPLERVIEDLAFFISHDVKQVKFVDRTFNALKNHYLPILKFLTFQNCRTNFHFEVAADIWDEEALEILKIAPAGRFQLEIGVQSTKNQTLKAIKRSNNFDLIAKNVRQIKKHGNIHLHLDLIAGLPYEDLDSFSKSFDDVYSLEPDLLQLGFLKLLKGCGLRKETIKTNPHGYIFMDDAPYEVLANKYLSYANLRRLKLFEKVFDLIYNSGKFRLSLKWLIKEIENNHSPFYFYDKLSEYWQEQGWQYLAHNPNSLYKYLAGFCQKHWPDLLPVFLEFLKFDFLISQKWFNCPEFLNFNESSETWKEEKNSFWRNTALVRRYLPEFNFSSWRDVKKNHHIEVFSVDIPSFIQNWGSQKHVIEEKTTAVLFSAKNSGEKNKETVFQVINFG